MNIYVCMHVYFMYVCNNINTYAYEHNNLSIIGVPERGERKQRITRKYTQLPISIFNLNVCILISYNSNVLSSGTWIILVIPLCLSVILHSKGEKPGSHHRLSIYLVIISSICAQGLQNC